MKHLMFHLLLPGNQYPLHALCLVFKSRKSICDKVLSGTNCFTFEFASSRKMRHKMCSEKLSGWRRKNYATICPHLKPSDIFCYKKSCREIPFFQEVPLFASSIYFTLPEIVMGPIWVPNASINTSWASLRILIIRFKTISRRSISKLIAINTIENIFFKFPEPPCPVRFRQGGR